MTEAGILDKESLDEIVRQIFDLFAEEELSAHSALGVLAVCSSIVLIEYPQKFKGWIDLIRSSVETGRDAVN